MDTELESLTQHQLNARGVAASESVAQQMAQNTQETKDGKIAQQEDNMFGLHDRRVASTFGVLKAYGGVAKTAVEFGSQAFDKEDQQILGIFTQASGFALSTAVGLAEAHRNLSLVTKQISDLDDKMKAQDKSSSDGGYDNVTITAGTLIGPGEKGPS